jgi:hypothetical protein
VDAIREACQVKRSIVNQEQPGGAQIRARALHRHAARCLRILVSTIAFSHRRDGVAFAVAVVVRPDRLTPRLDRMPDEQDQTYDEGRARNLEALLRSLAQRILELDKDGRLLPHAGELMKLIGDVRSELFHYEVRATYDTPEVAENRRIVRDARQTEITWEKTEWNPDGEDDPQW